MTALEAVARPNGLNNVIPILEKAEPAGSREPHTGVTDVVLSQDLEDAFREIKDQFTIDTEMLKNIVEHFQTELTQGLTKENQNIVRHLPRLCISYCLGSSLTVMG